jgi:hypothetical protein
MKESIQLIEAKAYLDYVISIRDYGSKHDSPLTNSKWTRWSVIWDLMEKLDIERGYDLEESKKADRLLSELRRNQ